jgi:hypothetical protein
MFVLYNQTQALELLTVDFLSKSHAIEHITSSDDSSDFTIEGLRCKCLHAPPWLLFTIVKPDNSIDCLSLQPKTYIKPILHRQISIDSYESLSRHVYPQALDRLYRVLHLRLFTPPAPLAKLSSDLLNVILAFLDKRSISRVFRCCKQLHDKDSPVFWRVLYLSSHPAPPFKPYLVSWRTLCLSSK